MRSRASDGARPLNVNKHTKKAELERLRRRATPDARERIPTVPSGTTSSEQTSVPEVRDRWDYLVSHASSRSNFSRKRSWRDDRFRKKRQRDREKVGCPADRPRSRRCPPD